MAQGSLKFIYNSQSNKLTSPHRFHHRMIVVVVSAALKYALISPHPLDFQPLKAQPYSR